MLRVFASLWESAFEIVTGVIGGSSTSGDLNWYFPLTNEAEHLRVFIENLDFLFSEEIFLLFLWIACFYFIAYKSFLIFWKGIFCWFACIENKLYYKITHLDLLITVFLK